jgi:penicillin-binding protein 2
MSTDNFASDARKSAVFFLIVGSFLLLVFRLFQMQIMEYKTYNEKAADNSVKGVEQPPLRGIFYDRNHNVLVDNTPAYTLRITPAYYNKKLNKILENVINEKPGYVEQVLNDNKGYSKYVPIRIKRGIDFKVVAWLEENSEDLPGVDYIVDFQRSYPAGVEGSHIFGYTKEISPQLLKTHKDTYKPGDYIGYTGIEKSYEKYLRGEKGYDYVLVDSKQREISMFKNGSTDLPAKNGDDLVLTIDEDVQKVAEQELKGRRGAAVAIDPSTGEILALVSAPEYNLNNFAYVTSKKYLDTLYSDPNKPLFDRATMSLQPPGSTFKPLVAIAALDLGVINTSTTFYCPGYFNYGRTFKCDAAHGTMNVISGIEKSCNVFFYNTILRVGLNNLDKYANMFGFGRKTGIDIGDESDGFIPDENYYKKLYGDNWPRSILCSLGIGQGEISVTPLQLAQYVSLIANDGISYQPHLVRGYIDQNTKHLVRFKTKEIKVNISKNIFDIVKQGMYLVVNGPGTAANIRLKDIQIAGKTGTAQNPHGKNHAWFMGFAPFDHPQIAVAVLVENVGFGSTYAAPIAQKMILAYLKKNKTNEKEKNIIPNINTKILGASVAN